MSGTSHPCIVPQTEGTKDVQACKILDLENLLEYSLHILIARILIRYKMKPNHLLSVADAYIPMLMYMSRVTYMCIGKPR